MDTRAWAMDQGCSVEVQGCCPLSSSQYIQFNANLALLDKGPDQKK